MTTQPFKGFRFWQQALRRSFSRRNFIGKGSLFLALQAANFRKYPLLPGPSALAPDLELATCAWPLRSSYPPQLQSIIAKLDPANDQFPSEVYVQQLEEILDGWNKSLPESAHNFQPIAAVLSDPMIASPFEPLATVPLRANGALRTERRSFAAPQQTSQSKFLSALAHYFAEFSKVDLLETEIFQAHLVGGSPQQLDTNIRYDIVGTSNTGRREERVGSWAISWIREEPGTWKIREWSLNSETRSILGGPGFTDITAQSFSAAEPGMKQLLRGIDGWRTLLDGSCGIDVYGNHGLAVGDIDSSGFDSLYVCQPSGLPNRLYRNRGDGTFEDITEKSGTGILDGTASALFLDFQNRGQQDLLVVRATGPLLFLNRGDGRFEPKPDAFQFARPPLGTFTSAAAVDYNRDGLLDLYFCVYSYYQGLNQYQFPTPYYDAQNGPPNFLFRNRGDGTFEDVTVSSGIDQNNNRFSFAAAWCDYDNSGWPSLYVANDFGRKNLYRNNGDGTFTDVAAELGVEDYGPGMSACWLDYDNDGLQDIYVANMWLKEGKRITANERFLPAAPPAIRALYQKHNAGNSLYRNTGKKKFDDKISEAGCEMARWSWSCAAWDFDNDGYSDLYVANGFVSGQNSPDLQSFFWRQVAQRSFPSDAPSTDYELAWNAINELVRSDYSWSGNQRNVFFANNHDGTFAEIPGILGLDLRDDSRAFALSDFDHDGRLELALKNRTGPQLRLLRNNLEGIGNSVTLRLNGRTSNRDAIGTIVTLEAGGKRQTKFVSAGSGFASQHTKELHFGIGDATSSISIAVRWPTGIVQQHENLPVNSRIEIVEGQKTFTASAYRPRFAPKQDHSTLLTAPPPPTSFATWLIAPLHGPAIKLADFSGNIHDVTGANSAPVLLSLLRLNCPESRKQIEQLDAHEGELKAAGLSLFAAVVDAGAPQSEVQAFAQSLQIDFPILLMDAATAGAWNIQYRYLFDRRRDLSFPLSLLFDRGGGLLCMYHGEVLPQSVVEDWRSANANPSQQFLRALPLQGPYFGNEMKHNYFTYGVAFVEYGYPAQAQAAFQRVVASDPNYGPGWFNLGTLYLNQQSYAEARKCLLEAVRCNPRDADAWNNLGMVSGNEGKYDEALEQFHRAAQINPNYMIAVQNMIHIYEFQRRPADAQKILEELIAHSPQNAELHQGLAMTFVAQNENERARKELEIALRLRPNSADLLNNLGVVLLKLGDQEQALQRFEECQKLAPDFNRPYINAALIYKNSGQPARAENLLQDFLTRHPDDAQVRAGLEKMRPE